jgi:hypothetical protein
MANEGESKLEMSSLNLNFMLQVAWHKMRAELLRRCGFATATPKLKRSALLEAID